MSNFKKLPKIDKDLIDTLYDAVADIEHSLGQPADTRWRAVCEVFGIKDEHYERYCWAKMLEYALFELKERFHLKINDTQVGKCIPTKSGHKNAVAVAKDRQRRATSRYKKEYETCHECETADGLRNHAHEAFLYLSNEQHEKIPEAVDILTAVGVLNTASEKPVWLPAVSDLHTKSVTCREGTHAVYITGSTEVWRDGVLEGPPVR